MTVIPLEVLVPQVFFIFKMAFSPLVCMVIVGVLHDLCTDMSFAWASRIKLDARENGRVHFEEPMQIGHFYMGASHSIAQCTSPIAAQPAWLKSCETDHRNMTLAHRVHPIIVKDQPRSKYCSTLGKGIGVQSIATSQSSVRVMQSHKSKSLNAGGHNTDLQNVYKSTPLWRRHRMSSLHAKFEQEFHILLACFYQENAQLVKFFVILGQKK